MKSKWSYMLQDLFILRKMIQIRVHIQGNLTLTVTVIRKTTVEISNSLLIMISWIVIYLLEIASHLMFIFPV